MKIKLFFISILIIFYKTGFSQELEIPVITKISVDTSQSVIINWQINSPDDVDGYIVKRLIIDGTGVVNGTYNTIGTIDKNNIFEFSDTAENYGTKTKPNIRQEFYRIVSYKNIGGTLKYSNMSEAHGTIFLSSEFDRCKSMFTLKWTPYTIAYPDKYVVFIYKPDSLFLGETVDTFFTHNIIRNTEYQYRVGAVYGSDTAWSNICGCYPQSIITPQITCNYVTVAEKNVIYINFQAKDTVDTKLYILERSEHATGLFDTLLISENSKITYTDSISTDTVHYYRIRTVDICDRVSNTSQLSNNIVLKAKALGSTDFVNNLQWNDYAFWQDGVENYLIIRSIDGSDYLKTDSVNSTAYTDDLKPLVNGDLIKGEFSYYIVAQQKNGENTAKSNTVTVLQENEIQLPTAINPFSNIERNRVFRPKLQFAEDYILIIYGRFGNKIFESSDYTIGWDGKDRSGKTVERGTYTYFIRYRDVHGKRKALSGYVNVIY